VVLDTFSGDQWFVVGNASIAYYILDLLNVDHPENSNWSPILVCRGYPIRLMESPAHIHFIFILDCKDMGQSRENPMPIVLFDRLIYLTIDQDLSNYVQRLFEQDIDPFGVMETFTRQV
jgi:hypothetical protein